MRGGRLSQAEFGVRKNPGGCFIRYGELFHSEYGGLFRQVTKRREGAVHQLEMNRRKAAEEERIRREAIVVRRTEMLRIQVFNHQPLTLNPQPSTIINPQP